MNLQNLPKLPKTPYLIAGALLLMVVLGFWFWQRNGYSKDTLRLEIVAPKEIVMGEEISYLVTYKNNGKALLEKPVLVFEYPAGSQVEGGKAIRQTIQLDDLYPGQEQNTTFKARLFGKEGETKETRASLQYAPKNLNAQFESDTTTTTTISSVPLNFDLDLSSKIESGQQITFSLNYFSNSAFPLSDLRIKMEYPDGFSFAGATPSPIGDKEWKIGVLNKAGGGRITISGTLEGQVDEAKIFTATIGTWKEGVFTALKDVAKGIDITQTRLIVSETVNGLQEYIASPGEVLHYVIGFKNATDKNLENLFLVVSLDGRPFDMQSVKVTNGTFKQGDNSIVWEAKDATKLRFLGKGEEGQVEFWINVKPQWEVFSSQDNNFVLHAQVMLSDATKDFTQKVASAFNLQQVVLFQDEVFGNQGPLPPRVGVPTTFTVTWKINNGANDIEGAKIKGVLPVNVSLTGKIFPEDSHLTFDQVSREVVWDMGDVPAGAGTFGTAPTVSFQVQANPSVGQAGGVLMLLDQVQAIATDSFTTTLVSSSPTSLDTASLGVQGVVR